MMPCMSGRLPGLAALMVGALFLNGCKREQRAAAEEGGRRITTVGPETIAVVDSTVLQTGPVLSGSLSPAREARVRAEIAGTVLETFVEPGQRVKRGTLLARIEDRAVRDSYLSAKSSVRSAEQALQLARRNAERSERLAQAGALAEREREASASAAANAEAALADAQARLASAAKELAYTQVRAPIEGVVSERQATGGDVVQTGNALFTIVDPSSLELVGTVPAEAVGQLKPGAPVEFTVAGYPGRPFSGTLDRVNPTADPATRQVRVYATLPNTDQGLVAGLFAEGRVGTDRRKTLLVPLSAVDQRGVTPTVLVIRGGKAEQQGVELGVREAATERIEVRAGLQSGDTVLIGAATAIVPGTAVRVAGAAVSDTSAVNGER